ncbi:MAG: class I SAM-dependent methyltransferase [Crenarchaeota archaeon]|nr:class I SAM-dependent methyltransferase [Thermoproteota archaeon]
MQKTYIDANLYDKVFEDFSEEDAQYIEDLLHKFREQTYRELLRALDVGCGTGRVGRYLNKRIHVIGLDVDLNMLKVAKKMIDVICCDITMLPIRDSSIDMAWSWLATLNYLDKEDLKKHIYDIHRVLRKYSIYILDVVIERFRKDPYEEYWKFRYDNGDCLFRYSVTRLRGSAWLELFSIHCGATILARSFITYTHSMSILSKITDDLFTMAVLRPFTFNLTDDFSGRCVVILLKV